MSAGPARGLVLQLGRTLASHAAGYASALVAQSVGRLVLFVLAARWLGPTEYGAWPLVQALMSYSIVIGLGVMPALALRLPVHRGAGEDAKFSLLLLSGARVLAAFWIAIGLAAILAFVYLPAHRLYAYGALLAVVHSMLQLFVKIRRANLEFRRLLLASALGLAWLPAAAALVWLHPAFETLYAVMLMSLLLQFAILADLAALAGFWSLPLARSAQVMGRLQRLGVPLMVSGALLTVLFSLDRWLVFGWLGAEALGHYALVTLVAGGLQMLLTVVNQVYYPRLAHAWGRTPALASLRAELAEYATAACLVLGPASVLGWLLLPAAVQALLPAYEGGVAAARWVLLGGLALIPAGLLASLLRLRLRLWLLVGAQTAGIGGFAIFLALAAVRGAGLDGVGAAVAGGYAAYAASLGLATAWASARPRARGDDAAAGQRV